MKVGEIMKCPYADVIDRSNFLFVNIQCYCMANSNPGNDPRRNTSGRTEVGVDLNKCCSERGDEYKNCPFYRKG